MSMTQTAAAYFKWVADAWDSLRADYFGEAVREAAIGRAYLRPEMVVADVGAGTGFMAAGLAPLVAKVYAVDGSPAMLEVCRRNLAGFGNVELRLADGAALPFADASLDAVFANMYLHHCPDPQAAIAEMVRVLKPDGRLSISDMVTAGPLPMSLRGDPRLWADCIYGALPEREYLDLVRQAGFVDVAGQRGLSGGQVVGVEVYSLSVMARKA